MKVPTRAVSVPTFAKTAKVGQPPRISLTTRWAGLSEGEGLIMRIIRGRTEVSLGFASGDESRLGLGGMELGRGRTPAFAGGEQALG